MNRLVDQQIRRNTETRYGWQHFAFHRDQVANLIAGNDCPRGGSLCVFGAGNCNDLDLSRILACFAEVHLVDIDSEAMLSGVAAQGVADHAAIRLHGNLDLTGICALVSQWRPASPVDDQQINQVIEAVKCANTCPLEESFDVVASVCLLSQLIEPLVDTLGDQHPRFLELLRLVRFGHLQQLVQSTRVGGTAILITDFVSSETAPEIASASQQELPSMLAQLIERRNFFHGMNPAVLMNSLCNDPLLSQHVGFAELLAPWVWDFGVRHYAVAAIRFQRL